jgi:two-component system, LuxR family, response regulator FixJ
MASGPARLTLVVVDDDEHIRRAVERFLRSHGHTVHVFDSAEAYLARNCPADCAILDIDLPGISGLEVDERLRRQGHDLPVVFITGHDQRGLLETVDESRRSCLRKPLDEADLLDAIRRATSDQS